MNINQKNAFWPKVVYIHTSAFFKSGRLRKWPPQRYKTWLNLFRIMSLVDTGIGHDNFIPQSPALVRTVFSIWCWSKRANPGMDTMTFFSFLSHQSYFLKNMQNFKICSWQNNKHHVISEMERYRKRPKEEKHEGTNKWEDKRGRWGFPEWGQKQYGNNINQGYSCFLKCASCKVSMLYNRIKSYF